MRRTAEEIAKMRRAGRVVAEMHEATRAAAKPGVTTAELDAVARDVLERREARSNFLHYRGYPAVICTSPNDMIVHGIPGPYALEEGDILSIDCGAIIEGYHGDAAFTMAIGEVSRRGRPPHRDDRAQPVGRHRPAPQRDSASTRWAGPSRRWPRGPGSPSCGSTSGTPSARPCTRSPRFPTTGPARAGRCSSRAWSSPWSPWSTPGARATRVLEDGWSVVTADGWLSAHFEHTIAVTDDGPEVLTLP